MEEEKIRLLIFFTVLLAMISLEYVFPFLKLKYARTQRWPNNIALVVFNTLLFRLILPGGAVGFAYFVQQKGWGLFNVLAINKYIELPLSVMIFDLIIYWQHVCFHKFDFLWSIHKVHHADEDFDVTTGSRFHPIEILLSFAIKIFFILLIGPSAAAILAFEAILNGMAMFNHSNLFLPNNADKIIRKVFVTPNMHRVHHSKINKELNSNFGFNLSIWDQLFKTHKYLNKAQQQSMNIGLPEYIGFKKSGTFKSLLKMPFVD